MRHNLRRLTLWLLLPSALLSACMDVSPPTAQQEEDVDALLHSVRLPFASAVYGLNNDDSLSVDGVLADGRVMSIEPTDVHWKIIPVSEAITIDSVGRLHVQDESTIANTSYDIIAAYTVGSITRADTATIYVTTETYDIQMFDIVALDSMRGGPMILSRQFGAAVPQIRVAIVDVNGDTIEGGKPSNNPSRRSKLMMGLSDFATGANLPFSSLNIAFSDPRIFLDNLNLPENTYWISVSAYLYGKPFKDSILYQSTPPAALELLVQNDASGGLSIADLTLVNVVSPCALVLVYNMTNTPIRWTLSKTVAERECGGVLPALDGGVVPAGRFGFVTAMGYNSGQDITWTVETESEPKSSVGGTVHIKDPNSN